MQQQQQEATMQNTIGFAALDKADQGFKPGEITILTAGTRRVRRLPPRDRYFDSLDDG